MLALSFPLIRNSYAAISGSFLPILFYSVFIAGLVFIFYGNILGYRVKIPVTLVEILLVVFTFYLVYSLFRITDDRLYGGEKLRYFLINIILFYLPVLLVKRQEDLVKVFKSILFFGFFMTAYAVLSYLDLETYFGVTGSGRFATLGMNPIWMARYLTYAILCELFFINIYRKDLMQNIGKISILVLIILVQLFFAFLTGSRGPILAAMLGVIAVILIHVRFRLSYLILILGFIVLLMILILSFVPLDIANRLLSRDTAGQTTTLLRVMTNLDALQVFWQNKIFGAGLGSFNMFYLKYPHNILTESLAEFGIIGFSILVTIIFTGFIYLVRISKKIPHSSFFLILALYIASFVNANLSGHIGSNFYLFLSLGMIVAAYSSLCHRIENGTD